jgi:hypothetical protein
MCESVGSDLQGFCTRVVHRVANGGAVCSASDSSHDPPHRYAVIVASNKKPIKSFYLLASNTDEWVRPADQLPLGTGVKSMR